ncbi:MAG: dihydroorotate dehydrogenase [Lachnospiraceae bacterium]|nr:dihydroorotate dehydrogenase [Lachnospiraceae bacterium]
MNNSKDKYSPDLSVTIAGVPFKNPVMPASGCFGSGQEYSEYIDLNRLGAVVTKGVSVTPWEGNPVPRTAETCGGMLNAIGLQNPGLDLFIERDLSFLQGFDTNVIVNVCGHTEAEYLEAVERLSDEDRVDMLEINVSCPNVTKGAIAFGKDPAVLEDLTSKIKKLSKKPVIIKLTPNVSDITETARAAEQGGADAVSLINTLMGMKIDIDRRTFALANKTGGLSGPAIHPVAVRMVYEVSHSVSIPVIGMGGVMNGADAVEMLLAGASAVAVGCASFNDPEALIFVIEGIEDYMIRKGMKNLSDITLLQ